MRGNKIILLIFLSVLFLPAHSLVQAETFLVGPIVVSYSPAFSDIVFEDIGSGKTWHYESPKRIDWYTWEATNWTSDGCHIVISNYDESEKRYQYYLVPILSLKPTAIPSFGTPRWSPDGNSIVYYDSTNGWKLFVGDGQFRNIEQVLDYPEWISIPQWISNDEVLFFNASNEAYVWNKTTKQVQVFKVQINPKQARSETLIQKYSFESFPSPDYKFVLTDYPTLPPLDTRFTDPSEAPDYPGPRPGVPGFELYALQEGSISNIDVGGKVGDSAIWSPSGRKIALIPEPEWYTASNYGGEKPPPQLYIYDIAARATNLITDFTISYINPESFGFTNPQWSKDENWLSVQTNEYGAITYNILTKDIVKLKFDDEHDPYFVPDYDPIYWSPIMDYTDHQCNN